MRSFGALIACLFLTLAMGCGGVTQQLNGDMPSDSFLSEGTSRAVVQAKMPEPPASKVQKNDGRVVEVYKIQDKSELKKEMGEQAFSQAMNHIPVVGQIPGGYKIFSTASEEASEEMAKETVVFKVTYEDDKVVNAKRVGKKS